MIFKKLRFFLIKICFEIQCAEEKEEEKQSSGDKSYIDEVELFRALSGEKDAEMLKGLLEKIATGVESDIDPIILSPDANKSHRAVSLPMHTLFFVPLQIEVVFCF